LQLQFSIIIPVYNRPKEIEELLTSLTKQNFTDSFEVIVVEDGSKDDAKKIVKQFTHQLNINYFFKENSGAGLSRNFGMQKAMGNYFIILDSDVIVPENYLANVKNGLTRKYTDSFGGPDKAHHSFTPLQKAINYSMTAVLTTGGIRGDKKASTTFQPRSFNMGISEKIFKITKGFSSQKIGEDIDLTFRIWRNGFETQLLENAFVYHKRRTFLKDFFKQTFAFGTQRPKLNKQYPETKKITYWFPSLFILGLILSIILLNFGYSILVLFFFIYFFVILLDAFLKNKNVYVAVLAVITTLIQFVGYGLGFFKIYAKSIIPHFTSNTSDRMK